MRRILICAVLLVTLAGCGSLKYQPQVDVQCDALSDTAIKYWASLPETYRSEPIAQGSLDLYAPGTLSRLRFSEMRNAAPIRPDEVFAVQRAGLPVLDIDERSSEYALFFIPPRTAAVALGQWGLDTETRSKSIDYPAFIAVPEAAIRSGKCSAATQAFLVAAVELEATPNLPQLIVSAETMELLVNSLYLDARSSDQTYLAERIARARDKFVSEKYWRGWVRLKVTPRNRWFWAKWADVPEDGNLGEAHLGLPVDSLAVQRTRQAIRSVDMALLEDELKFIKAGWLDKVGTYHKALKLVSDNIATLEEGIRSRKLTPADFQRSIQLHTATTAAAEKRLAEFKAAIEAQSPWFVTLAEGDMYLSAMLGSLDDLHAAFNRAAATYADATRVGKFEVLDPLDYLSAGPFFLEREFKEPIKHSFVKTLRSLNVPIRMDTVASARPVADGKYVLTLRGLIGISDLLNSASGHLQRIIKSKASCSKHVRRVQPNVLEAVESDAYVRHFDVELESRTCWKIFGKRGWTRNARATARGRIYAELDQIGEGDLSLVYGWRAGVRVLWFDIGDRDDWRVESVRALVAQRDQALVKQYGLKITYAGFVRDNSGKAYLAVSIETRPVTASEAFLAYTVLSTAIQSDQ